MNSDLAPRGDASFASTHWSVVAAASRPDETAEARAALETLCLRYWYPLYVFVRRRGFDCDEAQDLTQGFFARLLEKRDFASATPQRGRFRTYLLAAFEHYLSNERDRAQAQKRGGGCELLSLDFAWAEKRYACEPSHSDTPEKAYARRWVLTLLASVLETLEKEHAEQGKQALFENLKGFLTVGQEEVSYRELSQRLATSEGALKVAVHRLRRRYRDLLQQAVAQTLEDPTQVREEIAFLLGAF